MIESDELIERWSHAKQVLISMPEHERQHHWDMGTWGTRTDCGTIACAAGQCGLNPWFRERGFRLDFDGREGNISNVARFFGLEGTARIFWNTQQRPVETVIEEMRAYLAELQRIAELTAGRDLPRIGEDWPEQGGVFAGARAGIAGAPDYFLIVGPEHGRPIDWNHAGKWASELSISGHRDFILPHRSEGRALFDRVPQLFSRSLYWLGEQLTANAGYAWRQGFNDGNQYHWDKNDKLWACAIRRITLQE